MVSHDIVSAVKYASHILHIGGRKQLFFGTTQDYAKSAAGKLFIGTEMMENE